MKKDTPFLDFHNESIRRGRMARGTYCATSGLCDRFSGHEIFELFGPTENDKDKLALEGKNTYFWASGESDECVYKYTELRQTIILFMAAVNNEL